MGLILGAATRSDSKTVASLIRRSFLNQAKELGLKRSEYPNYVAFDTAEKVRERVERGARVTVAHLGERAVGTVTSRVTRDRRETGEITRLGVLPRYRGNSFGSILIAHAEDQLRLAGMRAVELSIVSRFEGLRSYYEQLGYIATVTKRFETLPFEVLFLEKSLS